MMVSPIAHHHGAPVNDYMLNDSARTLARAIGNRWDGWYAVAIGRDEQGAGVLHLSFDRDHAPALSVGGSYQDYAVRLHPVTPPAGARSFSSPSRARASMSYPPTRQPRSAKSSAVARGRCHSPRR